MAILNYLRDKTVSQAGYGLHETRLLGVVPQGLPDFPDCAINAVVGIEKDILTPNLLDDLLAGDKLVIVLNQENEDLQRNALELEWTTRATQFERSQVELEVFSEPNDTLDSYRTGNQVALRIAVAVYERLQRSRPRKLAFQNCVQF